MNNPMVWQQLQFIVPADQAEPLSDGLSEAGAVAVDLAAANQEEIFEPEPQTTPLWDQTKVTGLFPADADINELVQQITALLSFPLPEPQVNQLAEQNWVANTQRDFQPMHFGHNLWICPSWSQPPNPEGVNIHLDPGVAFGTGTHPTTALCLEWLAANPPQNQYVIDYGCGSGVLAIAAAKLGAQHIWATDIDPQALQATRSNAEHNSITTEQLITAEPQTPPDGQADLLIANILVQPLIDLAPTFAKLLKTSGTLLLSGILENQIDLVRQAYEPLFHCTTVKTKEQWARITLQKTT